jgi:hypothetical protein
MFLPVAIGMKQHQVPPLVVLVVAVPMMQFDFFFGLDHLPTAQADPVLLLQDLSTKRRRRTQRHPLVAGAEVGLPVWVERVGLTRDLEVALGLDALPHPEDLRAGGRIGEPPSLSLAMGKVAVSDPAPGLVRVAQLGSAEQPPPHETVPPEKGLAAEGVAMVVGPAPQQRVEPLDARCRGSTHGSLAQGADLVLNGLEASRAGFDVQLGWLAITPVMFAPGLSQEVEALRKGGMTGFSADSRTPRSAKKALMRGSTLSTNTSREVAVTMKASAHRT